MGNVSRTIGLELGISLLTCYSARAASAAPG